MTSIDPVLRGQAFIGEAIVGSDATISNVLLWNPYGSGKLLVLDHFMWASGRMHGATGYNGMDLRDLDSTSGFSLFEEGHVANKLGKGFGEEAKALLYIRTGLAPQSYPFNRPHYEAWTSRPYQGQHEFLVAPFVIQQGRGKNFGQAFAGQLIVTPQWREIDDPLGVVEDPNNIPTPDALTGTPIGDMLNMSLVGDGNETTYGSSNGDTTSVTWGLDLGDGATSPLSRIVLKSPAGRSLCGATPGRAITYEYSYGDGTTMSIGASGTFNDTDYNVQKIWDQTLMGPPARVHSLKLTGPAVAGWRIAEAVFLP